MEWLKQFVRLFGFKNAQVESLHEWNKDGFKIRVWRSNPSLEAALGENAADIEAHVMRSRFATIEEVIRDVRKFKRVACVAVVDPAGNGVSFYPDWH